MIKKLLFCLTLLAIGSLPAGANERIVAFISTVSIEDDASLRVEEKITVEAMGRQIKRGIVREFPTVYKDRYGHQFRAAFEIESVRRDGQVEPFHTERRQNGVALYIGDADVRLKRGTYTYQIIYRTTRQIGYHDGYDELYWNVTGHGWRLPIDRASYTLHLPRHAKALEVDAYTGAYGDKGKDFRVTGDTEGLVQIETTRAFGKNEGLTVAVSFPTDLIYKPSQADKARSFFSDNAGVFIALIGLLGILAYYLYFWDLRGRDPEGGAIIPRFEPPEGFSPAAARYVQRMHYDRVAFSAAVINMAVKGFLTISDDDGDFTLTRTGKSDVVLTSGEKRIATGLLGFQDSIEMDNKNHAEISSTIRNFEDGLQSEYQHKYFATNRGLFYLGAGLTVLIMLAAAIMNIATTVPVASFVSQVIIGAIAGVTALFGMNWTRHRDAATLGLGHGSIKSFMQASRYIIMFLVIVPQFVIGSFVSFELGLALPVIAVGFGIINGAFFYLLKAPTRMGKDIQDEIEGFKLYLATAEEDRLNMLNPPEKTPELFEKFLPFALALGVDNEWSEKFASVLASAAEGGGSYHPSWYSGRHWHSGRTSGFSRSLNSALATSIASSAHAPGSSSGVGGGGFSGGGGGGGGGGGW